LEGIALTEMHREASPPGAPRTLARKVRDSISSPAGQATSTPRAPHLPYVDLHLVHALSPQAFDGPRAAGRRVRRPDPTLAIEDHNVPARELELAALVTGAIS
jgi:3-isopropylmalate/(R)-2-methylmalate dehydratase large subunit